MIYILKWAFDNQDSSCYSVAGTYDAIMELYGVLASSQQGKLVYAEVCDSHGYRITKT